MKFSDLCSDSESIKTFNGLIADLVKASSCFSGGVDPDSIEDLDPDSMREAEEAYGALTEAVRTMNNFLKTANSASGNIKHDRREEMKAVMEAANDTNFLKPKKQPVPYKPYKPTREDIQAAIDYGVS